MERREAETTHKGGLKEEVAGDECSCRGSTFSHEMNQSSIVHVHVGNDDGA